MEYYEVLLPLALIMFLSKLIGIFLKKISIPQVIGMILAGLLIGLLYLIPNQNILNDTSLEGLSFFSKIGVILIMFSAGLGTDLQKVKQTGALAAVITGFGIILPMVFGFLLSGLFFGFDDIYSCLFYGVILTATSVSVTVSTLKELGKLDTPIGTAIISAAVIDDIIGIILLSVIISLSGNNSTASVSPVIVLLKIVAFFALAILSALIVRRKIAHYMRSGHRRVAIFGFVLCFLLSFIAEKVFGVADITGAYITGLILSGLADTEYIDRKCEVCTYIIFGPVFFAQIGINTVIQAANGDFTLSPEFTVFGIAYVVLGLLGKLLGCGIGARICRQTVMDSIRAGAGMMVRAEVILICAQNGINNGMVDPAVMPFVLLIILISSFVTPIILKATYRKDEKMQNQLSQ